MRVIKKSARWKTAVAVMLAFSPAVAMAQTTQIHAAHAAVRIQAPGEQPAPDNPKLPADER